MSDIESMYVTLELAKLYNIIIYRIFTGRLYLNFLDFVQSDFTERVIVNVVVYFLFLYFLYVRQLRDYDQYANSSADKNLFHLIIWIYQIWEKTRPNHDRLKL